MTDTTIQAPAKIGAPADGVQPILVINGPNLNMLGTRQPEFYGHETLADVERLCREAAAAHGLAVDFRRSDSEAEIIRWIQQARPPAHAIVMNPAGFTSTSTAVLDALLMFEGPIFGATPRRSSGARSSDISPPSPRPRPQRSRASPSLASRSSSGGRSEAVKRRVR